MEIDHAVEEEISPVKRGWDTSLRKIGSMAHFFGVLIFIYTVYLAKPGFGK